MSDRRSSRPAPLRYAISPMATLNWIGKDAVVNHHRQVPYHLLRAEPSLSVGTDGGVGSGNLLVQGDNLLALKALLPYYGGKVKCIYIDPPYNTGNEEWIYNDNVNSPEMRAWLGRAVGKEAEDLSRHDKWLCMMYPRLALLREFLTEDGAIFVSMDDNEGHYCKALMDEVFGRRNFIATIIWQKLHARNNSAQHLSADHDFVLLYARDVGKWTRNKLGRSAASDADFWNPDKDERGEWRRSDLTAAKPYADGKYEVVGPHGETFSPRANRWWSISKETFDELVADRRIWWGKTGRTFPFRKRFRTELGELVPTTVWAHEEVGNNREAKQEITRIFSREDIFATPKPERLLQRILHIATKPGDLVLDSFAGSGTTGAVAHKMSRRWIMVEMGDHCQTRVAVRLGRVVDGSDAGGVTEAAGWLGGGGFRYVTLGPTLFDEHGRFRSGEDKVTFAQLAAHIFFTQTGEPIPKPVNGKRSPLIGKFRGTAYYLLFNGVLGDRRPGGGNVLTRETLAMLPAHDGPKVVFGEGCRLSAQTLTSRGITFRQIPYQVSVS